MFRSCQPPSGAGAAAEQQQGGEGDGGADVGTAVAQGSRRSWWGRPVVAQVQGSYSIAPLEDHSLEGSPESLVTCIMKVGPARQGHFACVRACVSEGGCGASQCWVQDTADGASLQPTNAWEGAALVPILRDRSAIVVQHALTYLMTGSLCSGFIHGHKATSSSPHQNLCPCTVRAAPLA